jgi:hypothetical protein
MEGLSKFFNQAKDSLLSRLGGIKSAVPSNQPTVVNKSSSQGMAQYFKPGSEQALAHQNTTPTVTPTPTQPPVPSPTPTILPSFQGVHPETQAMITNYFTQNPLQGVNVNDLINLAASESSLNPSNIHQNTDYSRTKDYGLFGINDKWQRPLIEQYGLTPENLLNPEHNMRIVRAIMKTRIEKGLNPFEPWYGADKLGLTSRK